MSLTKTLIELIRGILEIDPHSKHTHKKEGKLIYAFHIDKLNVIYDFNSQLKKTNVLNVEYNEKYVKLRNKEWMKEYSKQTMEK